MEAAALVLKIEKLPGADGIPVDLLEHGGDEIMNISKGIYHCICQNENLIRVVNKVIGNITTPLPKLGNFRLIKNDRAISLISHPSVG